MKRYISLIMATLFVLCCFTACEKKKKVEGAQIITDLANEEYAVVTKENGDLVRDDDGNLIVAITDENGKNVKDKNGENLTGVQEIKHAVIIGNTIEQKGYYVTIPEGWENSNSYGGIQIQKTGAADLISIEYLEDKKPEDIEANCKMLVTSANQINEGSTLTTKGITLNGKVCPYYSIFIPQTENGKTIFFGYIVYTADEGVYRFYITADHDIDIENGEINSIINSVKFKNASSSAEATTAED